MPATKKAKKKLDSIVSEAIEMMPQPTQVADLDKEGISGEPIADADSAGSGIPYLRDSSGALFDPTVHSHGKDGKPTTTKAGRFRKKKGSGFLGPQLTTEHRTAAQTGKVTADIIFGIGQGLGGTEWKPKVDPSKGIDEPAQMADAFANYYEATGRTDFPPGAIVVIALLSYAMPRFAEPETRSRCKRIADWFRSKRKKKDKESA